MELAKGEAVAGSGEARLLNGAPQSQQQQPQPDSLSHPVAHPSQPNSHSQLISSAPAAQASPAPSNASIPPPPPSDTGADAGSETAANPRKRKKASRACDFCHVNHQPCDNGQPKCSVCTKHNKPCLYLRPTKRRGPQKGYRTALNTYKESAAAWGAVLAAIPGLDALIEGHLRGAAGKSIVSSIKDSNQQDALITRWQQSSVFRAFFGHNGPLPGTSAAAAADAAANAAAMAPATKGPPEKEEAEDDEGANENVRPPPAKRAMQTTDQSSYLGGFSSMVSEALQPSTSNKNTSVPTTKESALLSDLVAKDAAQSAARASQTLASLGFAPDETIADFYSMGANPEPIPESTDPDFDPSLGTEDEQRAYYELLMGRSFRSFPS